MAALITLTSDQGTKDPYIAGIKGVLLSKAPEATLVDLSHEISTYDRVEAALFLFGAFRHFPEGTIHLLHVSPSTDCIAARVEGSYVVCADNGVLTLLATQKLVEEVRVLGEAVTSDSSHRQTFFGHEVLAPAAAHLALGRPFEDLGPQAETFLKLDWPAPAREGGRKLTGRIMHADRFGNLITNIHESELVSLEVERITSGNFTVYQVCQSFTDVPRNRPVAIFGTTGFLQLCYHGEPAGRKLGLGPGISVDVFFTKP